MQSVTRTPDKYYMNKHRNKPTCVYIHYSHRKRNDVENIRNYSSYTPTSMVHYKLSEVVETKITMAHKLRARATTILDLIGPNRWKYWEPREYRRFFPFKKSILFSGSYLIVHSNIIVFFTLLFVTGDCYDVSYTLT